MALSQNQAGVLQVDQAEPAPRLRRSEGWSRHSTLVAVVFRSGLAPKGSSKLLGEAPLSSVGATMEQPSGAGGH